MMLISICIAFIVAAIMLAVVANKSPGDLKELSSSASTGVISIADHDGEGYNGPGNYIGTGGARWRYISQARAASAPALCVQ